MSSDIGYHKGVLEDSSLPWKDALKFLGHVHSLGGQKDTGLLKIDLEGFVSRDSIFHNLLALQSYLQKLGSSQETAKKAAAIEKRIETLAISYQRSLDLQLAKHFFNTLGLPQEVTEKIYGSVAQAVSSQEVGSGEEFLLPVGFSGKDSGHAIYLGGRGDFKTGKGELTVHNLGALSEHHPKGPSHGNLSSFFPFAVTGISEGQGLTVWLRSVISALMKDEAGPAEQALYQGSHQLGHTPGSEELGQGLSPQIQQVVGNCSVKNLHSFLLTSLQRELGPEEGQMLYREVKEQVKEFARGSAQEHVQEEEEPLSLSIQEILTKDLPQKRLRNAVLKGDNRKLSEVLSSSAKIDVNQAAGKKALLEIAIDQRNVPGAVMLLQAGATVTEKVKEQVVLALLEGQKELLAALVSNGVNPNLEFLSTGRTLLHFAALDSRTGVDMAEILLKAGANPNARDPAWQTPLHLAAREKRKEMALYLLTNGADPTAENGEKKLPYQLAEEKGDEGLAEILKPKN